jgi:hypothetical protein
MLRNFLKQYINADNMELKKLSAGQFMEIWENYDIDGKLGRFEASSYF